MALKITGPGKHREGGPRSSVRLVFVFLLMAVGTALIKLPLLPTTPPRPSLSRTEAPDDRTLWDGDLCLYHLQSGFDVSVPATRGRPEARRAATRQPWELAGPS